MKPKDPIFAPITYGDDRQVTRTRRGLHSLCELELNPEIVYCNCQSCSYNWEVDKDDYDFGLGGRHENAKLQKNTGHGGTGNTGYYHWTEYGKYTELIHDCCTGGIGLCAFDGQLVEIGLFYPLTGCTGENGELNIVFEESMLQYNTLTGELIGSEESLCLADPIKIYKRCIGQSGEAGAQYRPRIFGGYPVICPNCCKVNFSAKYILLNDNPEKTCLDSDFLKICKAVVVIDFQRMKSHFV